MPSYAFFHKQFMPLSEAKIGILTHAFHYGTACFDGIRGNWDSEQQRFCLFRVQDHYERLLNGCRLLKISLPYSANELCQLTTELVTRSGYHEDVYIRPLAYKSSETLGVRLHDLEDDLFIIVTTLPPYLGTDRGTRCCTSSWRRVDDTMIPARGKICGIYVNSALAKTEAWENGFDEAILLTQDGHVSEGSGENIFLVINGKLVTPPSSDNILMGITRDTVLDIAKRLKIPAHEHVLSRHELYISDESFLTGTAAEIVPVVKVDGRRIGNGKPGKVTERIMKEFHKLTKKNGVRYNL